MYVYEELCLPVLKFRFVIQVCRKLHDESIRHVRKRALDQTSRVHIRNFEGWLVETGPVLACLRVPWGFHEDENLAVKK